MSQLWERSPIAESALSVVMLGISDAESLQAALNTFKHLPLAHHGETLIPVKPGQVEALQPALAGCHFARLVPHDEVGQGMGSALRIGIKEAKCPLVLTLPIGYDANQLPLFLKEIDQVDIVAGVRKSKISGWKRRQFFSKAYQLFGIWMQDPECGMKLYRREIFDRLPIQSKGSFAQIEILAKANFQSRLLTEVEIDGPATDELAGGGDFWKVLNHPDLGPVPEKVTPVPVKPIIVSQAPEARL
jgi:hypothetical protein